MYTAHPSDLSFRFSHWTVNVMESSVFIPFEWATPVEDVPVTRMGRAIPLEQDLNIDQRHALKQQMEQDESHLYIHPKLLTPMSTLRNQYDASSNKTKYPMTSPPKP